MIAVVKVEPATRASSAGCPSGRSGRTASVERDAFLQPPPEDRDGFLGFPRKHVEMQHEDANYGIGDQQSDVLALGPQAREHAAHRGPHFRGVHDVRFDRRRINRTRWQRFDRKTVQSGARARPPCRRNVFSGDLAGDQRVRNGIEPARHAADQSALVNSVADAVAATQ
jgi:hypothetical protein